VPAAGYWLDSGAASLIFSGDTGPNPALWQIANGIANLRHLIIETSFCNRDHRLAMAAGHLCPRLLGAELRQLARPAQILITHLKPGDSETTMAEIMEQAVPCRPEMLRHGQVFEF
jgi:ribonuclease BN (tRNA processing enzyme)